MSTKSLKTRVRDILARITYRPGVTFYYRESGNKGEIVITRKEIDSQLGDKAKFESVYPVDPAWLEKMDERTIVGIVLAGVFRMEEHEVKEWFKFDGKPVEAAHEESVKINSNDPVKIRVEGGVLDEGTKQKMAEAIAEWAKQQKELKDWQDKIAKIKKPKKSQPQPIDPNAPGIQPYTPWPKPWIQPFDPYIIPPLSPHDHWRVIDKRCD